MIKNLSLIDKSIVDGNSWYTVCVDKDIINWLNSQLGDVYIHEHNYMLSFADVPAELYTLMKLKFA